jgi:hypothetical protein
MEIEKRQTAEELEQQIAAEVLADFGDDADLQIPLLKVAQGQTAEVASGDASVGDFVNALTGDVVGKNIEFIVCGFEKGRFRTNEEGEVICTGREGACGCHGGPYEECPDAEEQFRAAVKRGDREWGHGPPCATTYNFTGFVLGTEMPVRISLKRGQAKAARKWLTMLRFSKAPWDIVYEVSTVAVKSKDDYPYQTVNIRQGRKATPEERQNSVALATGLRVRDVKVVGDDVDPDAPAERPENTVDY